MSKLKLFVVFTFLLQIGTANAVSFDCSKAKSYSEKLICNNSELSELDDKLNSLYQKVKLESTDKKAFRKIVSDLWNEREKCKTE
ncbi:TPA: lysozyme inhibitor LprI family protein, partial [Escherichia coli]